MPAQLWRLRESLPISVPQAVFHRMSDPKMIKGIQNAVSIPVMAKCRIGHFAEAQILEAIEIDYIDESEVLSPADDKYHIDKTRVQRSFRMRCKGLGRGAPPYQRRRFHDKDKGRTRYRRRCSGCTPYENDAAAKSDRLTSMCEGRALSRPQRIFSVPYELGEVCCTKTASSPL